MPSRSAVWQTWPRPSHRLQVPEAGQSVSEPCNPNLLWQERLLFSNWIPELCDDSHRGVCVTHEAEVRAPTREVMSLWPLGNVLKCTQQQSLHIVLLSVQTQTVPFSPE